MRIAGITIPEKKRLEIALTALYGVGRPQAARILATAHIEAGRTAESLSTEEESRIRDVIEQEGMLLEGELRREVGGHIKRLKDVASYRGTRHIRRLPARGQRTKTNARTLKGARKTAGSGKRKVEKK
jgi:small subunit ribosomal protein S13